MVKMIIGSFELKKRLKKIQNIHGDYTDSKT